MWRGTEVATGARLDVRDEGSGPPVVLVQTALTADELVPLADHPALAGHRRIAYHRRGYAGSSPASDLGSVVGDARDCLALLDALGVESAHLVGFSYSTAVAMQVASWAPERTLSLVLIEPPPVHTPYAGEFGAVNDALAQTRRAQGAAAALDEFLTMLLGEDWRTATEAALPGSVAQMERDAATFFDTDIPALRAWEYDTADAGRVTCPVLHVGGTESGPWFAASRELVREWFPTVDVAVVEGADHGLMLTHTDAVARAVGNFLPPRTGPGAVNG